MNCKVCGSSEFVTNDGITYCTECQSQIEETQTEVTVEPSLSWIISSSVPKKSKTSDSEKELSDWISVECFNYILCKQVSALIELGASPKLKGTVLYIWSKYLQKCEVAFRIDHRADSGKPLLGPMPPKRDLSILYNIENKSKRRREKSKASDSEMSLNETLAREKELNETSASEGELNETSASEGELNETSANNIDSGDTSDSSVVSKKKYLDRRSYSSSHTRKLLAECDLKKNECKIRKRVFNMTLSKTLSICYMGLLYTEDKVLLSDLIRFAYDEKIPYVNVIDKLPQSMKFEELGDFKRYLVYAVPDAFTIFKTAHEIAKFVNLPEFRETSFSVAAARFVVDLNLPVDFLPLIELINRKYKELLSNYWKIDYEQRFVPQEYQALASLLVAMKMFFILDDRFENEYSEVMKKFNTIHPDHKYFDWDEWKKHSIVKEYLFLCDKPYCTKVNKLDGLSADQIISKYPFTRIDLKAGDQFRSVNSKKFMPFKSNIIKEYSKIVDIPENCSSIPTSFPLRRAVKCLKEEWRTLPMYKETKEIDFTLLNEEFSSCSLLFDTPEFNREKNETYCVLMSYLYSVKMPVDIVTDYDHPVCIIKHNRKIVKTLSKYWFLSDLTTDLFDKLPSSFKWLINFVSKYAYCNNFALYSEVAQIEKILFLSKD